MRAKKDIIKPIRFTEEMNRDIEQDAAKKGKSFAEVVRNAYANSKQGLTPAKTARLQNITNRIVETYGVNPLTQELSKEVSDLWKF